MAWVLFFDGDCAFCVSSVRWVVRWDKQARISFAPLQGELAREMGLSHHAAADGGTMVLLRESDGRIFTESDALIELVRAIGGIWRFLAVGRIIPKSIRDALYRWVSRNRLRLMGRTDACLLADAELRKRLRE